MGFIEHVEKILMSIGPLGLSALAFLDSAGVPTLGGPDVVLLLLARRCADLGSLFTLLLAAVVGSVLGCIVIYYIGLKGGEKVLAKFGAQQQREWVRARLKRYDFVGLLVSALGPPPYPTKLFVLIAGVLQMNFRRMLAAMFLGRVVRYSLAGYLGFAYGDQAAALLREYYPLIFAVIIAVLLLAFLVQYRRHS